MSARSRIAVLALAGTLSGCAAERREVHVDELPNCDRCTSHVVELRAPIADDVVALLVEAQRKAEERSRGVCILWTAEGFRELAAHPRHPPACSRDPHTLVVFGGGQYEVERVLRFARSVSADTAVAR